MRTIPLYRYIRPDGGVTVSTVKPDTEYTELTRLVAEDGYMLTDGEKTTHCIDTNNPEAWTEIPDVDDPNEATEADYRRALAEFGVEVRA